MNAKYILPFFIFLVSCQMGIAQQLPVFNQQAFDGHWYNPAQMGSSESSFVGVRFRSQWAGSAIENNPQTFGVQADLSKVIGLDRIGLGLALQNDRIHFLSQTDIDLSFAYHLVNDGSNFLSAGILAGWNAQNINLNNARVNNTNDALLFQGEGKSGIFQAGFGLHYNYDQQLFVDVAFPQLIASNQEYPDQTVFYNPENQAMVSLSYKTGGTVSFEPNIMIRETLGEKGLKAGRTDVNLRVHFLEEKFSVRAGYRLGANALIGGVGLKFDPITLAINYETHEIFGGTFELGAKLNFGESKEPFPITENKTPKPKVEQPKVEKPRVEEPVVSTPDPPVASGTSSMELARNLESGQLQAQSAANRINDMESRVSEQMKLVTEALASTRQATSMEGKKYTYNKLKDQMDLVRPGIAAIEKELTNIAEAKAKSKRANDEINNRNLKIARSAKMYKATQKAIQQGESKGQPLVNQFNRSEVSMNNFASANGLGTVNLPQLIAANKTTEVARYFQTQLDAMLSPPEDLLPVIASQANGRLLLDYRFSSDEEKYNLDTDLEKIRYLCNHLINQVKTIEEQGLQVEKISITTALGYGMSDLNLRAEEAYAGEYGFTINVNGKRTDVMSNQTQSRTMSISKGAITIEQVAGLKLYSLQKALSKGGLENIPVELNWSAGNPNQDYAQLFTIRFFVK